MPTYEFGCPTCGISEKFFSMSEVPDESECAECGTTVARRMSAPYLSKAGSSAYGLIDRAATSADSPQVVTSRLPSAPKKGGARYTSNPLHKKLPRA